MAIKRDSKGLYVKIKEISLKKLSTFFAFCAITVLANEQLLAWKIVKTTFESRMTQNNARLKLNAKSNLILNFKVT